MQLGVLGNWIVYESSIYEHSRPTSDQSGGFCELGIVIWSWGTEICLLFLSSSLHLVPTRICFSALIMADPLHMWFRSVDVDNSGSINAAELKVFRLAIFEGPPSIKFFPTSLS
jgi:hypothetical protein